MNISDLIKTNSNVTLAVNALDLREWAVELIRETKQETQGSKEEEYLTQKGVEKILGTTHSTLWRWDKQGYLNKIRVGGKIRYKRSDVEKILKQAE